MLIDRYVPEDVFARVPELAAQTDPVLQQLDGLRDDDALYGQIRADLARRYPHTLCRGRHSTPVEVILRRRLVKHLYNWSHRETARRVADSLLLRWFCRVYFHVVPDATTLLRGAQTIQPATLVPLNDRVVTLARQARVTSGRKLRIDGTVVQTTIHHPTASSLLADGVRVLSRVLRRSQPLVQDQVGAGRDTFRTRLRTMRRGLQTRHRRRRRVGAAQAEQRQAVDKILLTATVATLRQVDRVRPALQAVSDARQPVAARLLDHLDHDLPLIHTRATRTPPNRPRKRSGRGGGAIGGGPELRGD